MAHSDAIVVGSRCAGASVAMLLARQGRRVLALDRARFPSDTMSTHFMPPRATSMLAAWGLLPRLAATGCPLIDTITVDLGPVVIRGTPDAVNGTNAMYSPRRSVLDHLLVTAAREAGADVREGVMVKELVRDGDRVIGVRSIDAAGHETVEHAAIVIGADGLWSRVARDVDARVDIEHASLTCGNYAYWEGVPTEGVEFYRRPDRVVLLFPTHDNLTCIYVGVPYAERATYGAAVEATFLSALECSSSLSSRVRAGRRVEPFRGTSKLPNFYRQSWGRGWALVGDAAYHRDPITGMGIGDAFLGAQLLADALGSNAAGRLDLESAMAGYQRDLRERTRDIFDYTLRSAQLIDPAPLMDFYLGVSRNADATRQLLNVVTGTASYRTFFNESMIDRLSVSAAVH